MINNIDRKHHVCTKISIFIYFGTIWTHSLNKNNLKFKITFQKSIFLITKLNSKLILNKNLKKSNETDTCQSEP